MAGGSAEKVVQDTIKSFKVAVFSKSYCPFCTMAKSVLGEYDIDPSKMTVIELDNRRDGSALQAAMAAAAGARTVPQVFINGKCYGGGTETRGLHRSGQLRKLLSDAGALRG